jgi:nitroimidazol reductase NimA-like FMN-containing flavoprotein (pyridoxamine 5'-phosphate oxidase superfamily)
MTVENILGSELVDMEDEAIRAFLSNQSTGVLGLPTDGVPYLLPMSYGFDGDMTLYFTFIGGQNSRKRRLLADTDRARFLVSDVRTQFNWESVLLTGTVSPVPETDWDEVAPILEDVWRPDVFEAAMDTEEITLQQFVIDDWSGLRQTGLPPGFE